MGLHPLPGAPLCPPQPRGPTPPPSPRWPGLAVWLPQRTVSRTVPPETDPAPAGASSTRPTPQDLGAHGPAGQGVLRRRATSAGGGAGSAPGSSWGAGGSRAPAPHLCTGEGTHADHLQHRAGGPQGAEQGEGVWVGAGAVSDHVLGAGCVGGEQGSGPWTSGVQASGGRRSVPRCGAGSREPGPGPAQWPAPEGQCFGSQRDRAVQGRLPTLGGTGPRPPARPALRVAASDSVDRSVCCLLIHPDSFTGTAGWVPTGRPQAHLPPGSRPGAEDLTARQTPPLFWGAGQGSLGERCGLAAPGP